jgi:hypothetical protein
MTLLKKSMAKQKGAIRLEGRIGDLSFFKRGNDYFVKTKGGPSSRQFKTSRRFERSRECGAEFKEATRILKIFKAPFGEELRMLYDRGMYGRLTKMLIAIVRSDTENERGKRTVNASNFKMLSGYSFGKQPWAGLRATTSAQQNGSLQVTILPFMLPVSADSKVVSHYEISCYCSCIDTGISKQVTECSRSGYLPLQQISAPFNSIFTVAASPYVMVSCGLFFYQEVNGVMMRMKEKGCLQIVAVV